MATKSPAKPSTEPITPPLDLTPGTTQNIDLEDAIAESLLNDIDWHRVRAAIISKAKHRFRNNGSLVVAIAPLLFLPSQNWHNLREAQMNNNEAIVLRECTAIMADMPSELRDDDEILDAVLNSLTQGQPAPQLKAN